MNGVHDMGGMHGFGEVEVEQNEPVFHARWEGVVRALAGSVRRSFNIDEFRHAIERIPPAEYLRASYYERWLYAIETLVREKGIQAAPLADDEAPATVQPRYKIGDRVRTRNLNPSGHTRLPRYARGKACTVRSVNGPFLLPDTNADHLGKDWQPVYAVEFAARDLWGPQAEANGRVCLDVWESYLEESGK